MININLSNIYNSFKKLNDNLTTNLNNIFNDFSQKCTSHLFNTIGNKIVDSKLEPVIEIGLALAHSGAQHMLKLGKKISPIATLIAKVLLGLVGIKTIFDTTRDITANFTQESLSEAISNNLANAVIGSNYSVADVSKSIAALLFSSCNNRSQNSTQQEEAEVVTNNNVIPPVTPKL